MDSRVNRILTKVLPVRAEEATVALLMFAYSFLAMTAHNILRPITKSKAIDHLGADNLPYILMGSSVLIGVLMHLYGSAARRLPRQHVVPLTQSAIIVLLGVFWVLLKTEAVWVTIALYFFGQILGILLISQFWTLANDVYDARQAKRLFGLIGGGACLGGALGNSITASHDRRARTEQPAPRQRGRPGGLRGDRPEHRPPSHGRGARGIRRGSRRRRTRGVASAGAVPATARARGGRGSRRDGGGGRRSATQHGR